MKTYTELCTLPTFKERFEYCRLDGTVGQDTFGFDRYLNQQFYRSEEWKRLRDFVIIRDEGRDLGLEGYEIYGKILIHHLNPITQNDVLTHSKFLLDPEYLVCVSLDTHNAIHYGSDPKADEKPVIRTPNDTCPWKRKEEIQNEY